LPTRPRVRPKRGWQVRSAGERERSAIRSCRQGRESCLRVELQAVSRAIYLPNPAQQAKCQFIIDCRVNRTPRRALTRLGCWRCRGEISRAGLRDKNSPLGGRCAGHNHVATSADGEFQIAEGYERTSVHLDALRAAADANRDALGFFAASVYDEFAHDGSLYVLERCAAGNAYYAGHLLFSCAYPRAHVLQMFVLPEHRRSGHATKLLSFLKESLTKLSFISIYARVAEDLQDANRFWEQQKFYVQRDVQGGVTKNRRILIRSHELPSPQLFPLSGIDSENPLGLAVPSSADIPLFLLDLNVLFDVMPRRLRHTEATSLFQAERMNGCRLAISNEIKHELERTAESGRTDPMAAYIGTFPSFPLSDGVESQTLLSDLAELVFPRTTLTEADKSDLRHLATAIERDLVGFITSDGRILTAATAIRQRYKVQVVSPAAFQGGAASTNEDMAFEVAPDATLELGFPTVGDEFSVRTFLSSIGLSGSAIGAVWCPPEIPGQAASRIAIWKNDAVLGYLTWTPTPGSDASIARAAVNESELQAVDASRILLMHLLEQSIPTGPTQVVLELPARQSVLRELAFSLGFRGRAGDSRLIKWFVGKVFVRDRWNSLRQELVGKGGPKLPDTMPSFRNFDQQIPILTSHGNQTHVSLDTAETLLSPALLCLPGRPAVIAPIQRRFSEALLGHSLQRTLLPRSSASTYLNRHYLASPRALKHFKRGTLMFFYESERQNGRGELVALARVTQSYVKSRSSLGSDLSQSVLTESSLSDIGTLDEKTVVAFDNIFHLPNGIPRSTLLRLGCGRPNDLITAHPINDTQLQAILGEAFGHG
jgi:GNAT superfamily N-acetyltransferase